MKTTDIQNLLRENIRNLVPYSSARDEYSGANAVFLDANENPYNEPYNRYPDPYQKELKNLVGEIKGVAPSNIFLGNGSDEAIDILIRAFCNPGKDNIVAIHPSYGMYEVAANINDIGVRKASLTGDWQIDAKAILGQTDKNTKLVFLCSPNNPTSNSFDPESIREIMENFDGIVALDEAYIEFSKYPGFLPELKKYPNLVILQTFSKAWGMAGIRLGMAFADAQIIRVMSKIKYPYNINILSLRESLKILEANRNKMGEWTQLILRERERLKDVLEKSSLALRVYPSDSNFLMVKFAEPKKLYNYLTDKKVIVRDRSSVHLCEGCLRFTIGSPVENDLLISELEKYENIDS